MKTNKLPSIPSLRLLAMCSVGALSVALAAPSARADFPSGFGGTEFDLGDYQGHVDIPEIAGVPGSDGTYLWPPDALEATGPGDEWIDTRPDPVMMPIPAPGELPRDDELLGGGSGPMQILPAVVLPGSIAPSDGAFAPSQSVPGPGSGALVAIGLALAVGRRRR